MIFYFFLVERNFFIWHFYILSCKNLSKLQFWDIPNFLTLIKGNTFLIIYPYVRNMQKSTELSLPIESVLFQWSKKEDKQEFFYLLALQLVYRQRDHLQWICNSFHTLDVRHQWQDAATSLSRDNGTRHFSFIIFFTSLSSLITSDINWILQIPA